MQLNKNTGEILKIDKSYKDYDRVVFTTFENRIYTKTEDVVTLRKDFILDFQKEKFYRDIDFDVKGGSTPTIEGDIDKLFYEKIAEELGEQWLISEDFQNWLHSEKPVRIITNRKKSDKEILNNADYRNLQQSLTVKHSGFIKIGDNNITMYVNGLNPSEIEIVQEFINTPENPNGWIYTEQKIN